MRMRRLRYRSIEYALQVLSVAFHRLALLRQSVVAVVYAAYFTADLVADEPFGGVGVAAFPLRELRAEGAAERGGSTISDNAVSGISA